MGNMDNLLLTDLQNMREKSKDSNINRMDFLKFRLENTDEFQIK